MINAVLLKTEEGAFLVGCEQDGMEFYCRSCGADMSPENCFRFFREQLEGEEELIGCA